jgi:hypothetical protein
MSKQVKFDVLDESSNAIVARAPDRQFPGVLLQGDTLRILLDDVSELGESIQEGDYAAATEAIAAVEDQLRTLLSHYERTLEAHGMPLPYTASVAKEAR